MLNNIKNLLAETTQRPDWVVSSFPIIKLVIICLVALCSLFLVVAVLMQKGNSNGITGVTGEADTFYNRNKGKSMDGLIKKLTIIDSIVIFALCLVYMILNTIYGGGII